MMKPRISPLLFLLVSLLGDITRQHASICVSGASTEVEIVQPASSLGTPFHRYRHRRTAASNEKETDDVLQNIEDNESLEALMLQEEVLNNLAHGDTYDNGHQSTASSHANNTHHSVHDSSDHHPEIPPAHAILFPPFCLTLGVITFYLLSRFCHALPYTAVMFLFGMFGGIAAVLMEETDHISESLHLWINIDSEVLLLVFLPGLIFKDSHGLNVHLFRVALPQCLIFAFPMVLLGTTLTAGVAYYCLPYDWSLDLCMCFGAILSATDPVAVAALLEEVGAPPRLKVHIGGEALLNDGAAIVFFFIFLYRYLFELGIHGGEEVGWARGFELFFRMSLGGACIGFCFGIGLVLVLYLFDRRYNREENVVQVTATIAVAYTGYYVAEVVCHTSGVIATVVCGITTKFLSSAMINDSQLMEDCWTLIEHLLNTVLFVLGGVVWGSVLAEGQRNHLWKARDYGFMIYLYFMVTAIRFFLFSFAYPITSRIGLRTNAKETIFQVYGGLRGAVGIALAIALDNHVTSSVPEGSKYADQTAQIFAMVGGMAFLTLVINGSTAGPLLIKLGLADSTNTRKKIVEAYKAGFKRNLIDHMVKLLGQRVYRNVNFALVKHHVTDLKDLTRAQLCEAIIHQRESTIEEDYNPPYLDRILPYLPHDIEPEASRKYRYQLPDGRVSEATADTILNGLDPEAHRSRKQREREGGKKRRMSRGASRSMSTMMRGARMTVQEFRLLFLSILQSAYTRQTQQGELIANDFLYIALHQSLELAEEACANGESLRDWEFAQIFRNLHDGKEVNKDRFSCGSLRGIARRLGPRAHAAVEYRRMQFEIARALAFISAHQWAQKFFRQEFENADNQLSEGGKAVLEESEHQIELAELALGMFKPEDVESAVSHKFCGILLNSGAHYLTKLVDNGLLKDQEAEHLVHDIQHQLDHVLACRLDDHPDTRESDRRASFKTRQQSKLPLMEEGGQGGMAMGDATDQNRLGRVQFSFD